MKTCSEFEGVFHCLDEDGDGKISPTELQHCVSLIGEQLLPEEAKAMVESFDSDGDGLLGFDDFVRLIEGKGGEEEEGSMNNSLKEAFGMYEMDGSGFITPASLMRMLNRLGESKTLDECRIMISQFDLNGDGALSFDEFKAMII